MAKDIYFNNLTDLYNHVLPAIRTKISQLKNMNFNEVKELDIWDYCLKNIWYSKKDIEIYEMINDILFLDEIKLINYIRKRNA